jgi:hypothetical protein
VLITSNDDPVPEPEPVVAISTQNTYTQVSPPAQPQPPLPSSVETTEKSTAFMDMMEAISMILSARAILFLVLIGAFILAASAMISPTAMRLGILCAYCVLGVLPCVWLELRK